MTKNSFVAEVTFKVEIVLEAPGGKLILKSRWGKD